MKIPFMRRGERRERRRVEQGWSPKAARVSYGGSGFRSVEGLDDVKLALEESMMQQYLTRREGRDLRVHILLAGAPGVSKTVLLYEAERQVPQERRIFVLGSQASKAGLRDRLLAMGGEVDFILIDELDKMGKGDYDVLLSVMEAGRLSVAKSGLHHDLQVMATILATANWLEKIPVELLDRFTILYMPSYDSGDFIRIASRILRERGMLGESEATQLAEELWRSGYRSVRDAARLASIAYPGRMDRAMMFLEIMKSRQPPTEVVRRRGWRPGRG